MNYIKLFVTDLRFRTLLYPNPAELPYVTVKGATFRNSAKLPHVTVKGDRFPTCTSHKIKRICVK